MQLIETVSYQSAAPQVPSQLADVRADPQAFLAIHALVKAQTSLHFLRTAFVVLSDFGCVSHLDKVTEASRQKRIRPGNFTRMGPHTIATYLATAFQIHGPAFALVGNKNEHFPQACQIANSLLQSSIVDIVCLVMSSPSECTINLYRSEDK